MNSQTAIGTFCIFCPAFYSVLHCLYWDAYSLCYACYVNTTCCETDSNNFSTQIQPLTGWVGKWRGVAWRGVARRCTVQCSAVQCSAVQCSAVQCVCVCAVRCVCMCILCKQFLSSVKSAMSALSNYFNL